MEPKAQDKPKPRVRKPTTAVRRTRAKSPVPAEQPVAASTETDTREIIDGPWIKMIEEVFPIAWIAMLFAVSYIGVYFAVDRLAGRNLLPGPGWF